MITKSIAIDNYLNVYAFIPINSDQTLAEQTEQDDLILKIEPLVAFLHYRQIENITKKVMG